MVRLKVSEEERVRSLLGFALIYFIAEKYQPTYGNECFAMMTGIFEGLYPTRDIPEERNEKVEAVLEKHSAAIAKIRKELADSPIIVDGFALIYSFIRHFVPRDADILDEALVRARPLGLRERPISVYSMTDEELDSIEAYKVRGRDLKNRSEGGRKWFTELER